MELINRLNKTRMRFAQRRMKPAHDALAALATLSCCITTGDPQNPSARKPGDGSFTDHQFPNQQFPEQQWVDRAMQALQQNLEAPLLRTGWRAGSERPARPRSAVARWKEPAIPRTISSRTPVDKDATACKIDVPGVPLAIQLSTVAGSQSSAPEIETQLCWGMLSGVNMVVYIRASRQVTAELLQKIDWRQVGEGLEP
jgi:hypothetical protein